MNHISHHGSFIEGGSGCDSCRNLFWASLWISFVPNWRCWKCRKPDLKLHLILKSSHFSRTWGWRLENTKKPWVFSITNDYFTLYEIFGKKPLHLQSNNSDGKVKYFSFSVRCDAIEKHRESCRNSPRLNFQPFPMFNTYFLSTINILELDPWQILV